jgi:hypothetical protein
VAWSCWGWAAWDDALELHHGMITQRASVVPYHRIQQIDIHRIPSTGCWASKLILRTAAATSDAELPGIAAAHADELRHECSTARATTTPSDGGHGGATWPGADGIPRARARSPSWGRVVPWLGLLFLVIAASATASVTDSTTSTSRPTSATSSRSTSSSSPVLP